MNTDTNNHNCGSCGRPFPKATPKCNYCDSCLTEYCGKMPACIKKESRQCQAKAVIPAITTETADNITALANCFVHVTEINTTFYVDDKHRPIITWAGPVEIANYDIQTNPKNLRSQLCFTTVNGAYKEVYFDRLGVAHIMGTEA